MRRPDLIEFDLLTLKSPRKNTTAAGYFLASSSMQTSSSAIASRKSDSRPTVGRYIARWIDKGRSGGLYIKGIKDVDLTGRIVTITS